MSGNGEMSDTQTQILEDIREEMRSMRAEIREMRTDMNAGFAAVNARIDQTNVRIDQTNVRLDNVIQIVGTHHHELEERVSRIEDHLGLPR
jgi:hypothetical protein